MKQKEFSLALNALLPTCDPEAASKWAEFAAERVECGQFARFIPDKDPAASAEVWMDEFYAGLYAVKQKHGLELAAGVADLVCQRCPLYPGEMMQAAEILQSGGDGEQIVKMIGEDVFESEPPFFFDLPEGASIICQGPEISILRTDVPCGLIQKHTEPGYLLADGTVLLESERDSLGRYRGGAGMDGMYLQTGQVYAPVRGVDGQINAFQEVKPVTEREREAAFLSGTEDAVAVYQLKVSKRAVPIPLARLQNSGESPLAGNYGLVHVSPLTPGTALNEVLDLYQEMLAPSSILAVKQTGAVSCWYMDNHASSKLPGLLENHLKAIEQSIEQNANQIDGIINNEAPKPSLLDTLRQCQEDSKKFQGTAAPPSPSRNLER